MKKSVLWVVATLLFVSCTPLVKPTKSPISTSTPTARPNFTVTPKDASSYIGLEYPPLPNSITESSNSGMTISSPSLNWGIEAVTDGEYLMLWLTKTLYHDKNGHAIFKVTDVAVLPPTARDQLIVVSACLLNNVLDPEIVALVWLDEESLENRFLSNTHIVMAWRANQTTGKLEQLSKTGIECHAETFLGFP